MRCSVHSFSFSFVFYCNSSGVLALRFFVSCPRAHFSVGNAWPNYLPVFARCVSVSRSLWPQSSFCCVSHVWGVSTDTDCVGCRWEYQLDMENTPVLCTQTDRKYIPHHRYGEVQQGVNCLYLPSETGHIIHTTPHLRYEEDAQKRVKREYIGRVGEPNQE